MAEVPRLALPELARSLRTFGRPVDAAADAAHAAVFVPLLDARALASRGGAAEAVAALRGVALAARIELLARAAAAERQADPATARARAALVGELLEPLRGELLVLDGLATAVGDGSDAAAWDRWTGQLRRVFVVADVACHEVARILGRREEPAPPARRWFGGGAAR